MQCPVCWSAALASQGPLILATTAAGITAAKMALTQRTLSQNKRPTSCRKQALPKQSLERIELHAEVNFE